MKKTIISLVLFISIIVTTTLPTFAADATIADVDKSTTITYLDDGSYVVTTLTSSPITSRSTTFTKTGNQVVSVFSGDDELLCQYTLYGEFEVVSGVSAVCISATYTQNIYASGWTFSDGQAYKSGNTAYGLGKFTKKVLLITTKVVDIDISITCDIYGNLS